MKLLIKREGIILQMEGTILINKNYLIGSPDWFFAPVRLQERDFREIQQMVTLTFRDCWGH